jgi:hypothetical protein
MSERTSRAASEMEETRNRIIDVENELRDVKNALTDVKNALDIKGMGVDEVAQSMYQLACDFTCVFRIYFHI